MSAIQSGGRWWQVLVIGLVAAAPVGAATTMAAVPLAAVVDGDLGEWQGVPVMVLEDGVRVVAAAHDEDSLYLTWHFADERLARRLLRLGVTVWVDGDGKKRTETGIRYGGSEALAEALPPLDRGDGTDGAARRPGPPEGGPPGLALTARVEPGRIKVIAPEETIDLPEAGEEGWAAASAVVDGVYGYELRIPLAAIGGRFASRGPATERTLRVGLAIGGLTEDEKAALKEAMKERGGGGFRGGFGGGAPGMGGGPPGGGIGGGGRGMGGGPPGGGRRDMRQTVEGETYWFKLTIPANTTR